MYTRVNDSRLVALFVSGEDKRLHMYLRNLAGHHFHSLQRKQFRLFLFQSRSVRETLYKSPLFFVSSASVMGSGAVCDCFLVSA